MEIEQIVSTLRGQVGQTSLSDKTITDYINANLPAEGTDPDEAYFTKHAGILKSIGGNFSHDVAAQINAFKAQWAKEHPTPPAPPTPPVPAPDSQKDNPEMKALLDRIAALEGKKPEPDPALAELTKQMAAMNARFDNEAKEKTIKAMMSTIQGKAAGLNIADSDVPTWELAVEMVTPKVTAETTAEQAEKLVKDQYENLFKRLHPGGAKPYGEPGGGGNASAVKEWIESMKKRDEKEIASRKAILDSLK